MGMDDVLEQRIASGAARAAVSRTSAFAPRSSATDSTITSRPSHAARRSVETRMRGSAASPFATGTSPCEIRPRIAACARPRAASALGWDRATRTTSWPASAYSAPIWAPMSPAPTTATFFTAREAPVSGRGLAGDEVLHQVALLLELRDRRPHLGVGEGVELDALHDLPPAVARDADGEGRDEALRDVVAAVGDDRDAGPVVGRRRRHQAPDVVHDPLRGGERARGAACRDDRRAALLHRGEELALEPGAVDRVGDLLRPDVAVSEVRIEGRAVVTPDDELLHVAHARAGLRGAQRARAVLGAAGGGGGRGVWGAEGGRAGGGGAAAPHARAGRHAADQEGPVDVLVRLGAVGPC